MRSRILRPIGFLDCYQNCANNNCIRLKNELENSVKKNVKIDVLN